MSAFSRERFRRWRRTRPFWGGLLAIIAGLELISIPLAPLGLALYQGLAGIASWFAGVLLIAVGVLVWLQPHHRLFFGILAVLLSLLSFLTSNLGGLLLGMLLGMVGGALIFAWAPGPSRNRSRHPAHPTKAISKSV